MEQQLKEKLSRRAFSERELKIESRKKCIYCGRRRAFKFMKVIQEDNGIGVNGRFAYDHNKYCCKENCQAIRP